MLRKFIKDRRGGAGLFELIMVIAMIGIVAAVAAAFMNKSISLGSKAKNATLSVINSTG